MSDYLGKSNEDYSLSYTVRQCLYFPESDPQQTEIQCNYVKNISNDPSATNFSVSPNFGKSFIYSDRNDNTAQSNTIFSVSLILKEMKNSIMYSKIDTDRKEEIADFIQSLENQYNIYQLSLKRPDIAQSDFSSLEQLNAFVIWSLENICNDNYNEFDLEIRSTPTNAIVYYMRPGDDDYVKWDSPTDTTLTGLKMAVWKILVVLDSQELKGKFDPFTKNKDQRKMFFRFTEKK